MLKSMVLVPHPDDEINVAGGIMDQLLCNNYEVVVLFASNGFCQYRDNTARIREAQKAKDILGYQRMIMLGYEDGALDKYYAELKEDVERVLIEEVPDIIICCDADEHPDHRVLSLAFDDAMGEILSTRSWSPIVLKKFAYVGSYKGADDYFERKMQRTLPTYFDKMDECLSFPYKWEDRISFKNSPTNYPSCFWKSPLFKAAKAHWSQHIMVHFGQICNADVCFWYRSTDNLALRASILASSGEVSYLNDFKIVDTDYWSSKTIWINPSTLRCWHPSDNDLTPFIKLVNLESTKVAFIRLFTPCKSEFYLSVYINDLCVAKKLNRRDSQMDIDLLNCNAVESIILEFERVNGESIFVSEVEVFDKKPSFPWERVPFSRYDEKQDMKRKGLLLMHILYFAMKKFEPIRKRLNNLFYLITNK